MNTQNLQAGLQSILSPDYQDSVVELSLLLESIMQKNVDQDVLKKIIEKAKGLDGAVKQLAGTSFSIDQKVIAFGQGGQAGDITIGDVAGGHIINFSINHNPNSPVSGITFTDARQIAQDVFDLNFYRLAGEAKATARQRAEELVNNYLGELASKNPQGIFSSSDPDMQYLIFMAQREYARSGDRKLEEILVDILIERTKNSQRSLLQITLNEAIETAPRLTEEHIETLSFMLQLSLLSRHLRFETLNDADVHFKSHLDVFSQNLCAHSNDYRHLLYLGCIEQAQKQIEPIVFISEKQGWKDTRSKITTNSGKTFYGYSALQFGFFDHQTEEIWRSFLEHFSISPVGITIGYAHSKRKVSEFTGDLANIFY